MYPPGFQWIQENLPRVTTQVCSLCFAWLHIWKNHTCVCIVSEIWSDEEGMSDCDLEQWCGKLSWLVATPLLPWPYQGYGSLLLCWVTFSPHSYSSWEQQTNRMQLSDNLMPNMQYIGKCFKLLGSPSFCLFEVGGFEAKLAVMDVTWRHELRSVSNLNIFVWGLTSN
jgi:hypothetical protein